MSTENKKTLSQAEIDAELKAQFDYLKTLHPGADRHVIKNIKDKIAVLKDMQKIITDKK